MSKLLAALLATILVTFFAMDNMHHVQLGLIVGLPFPVRLFFLLATAFLAGCLTTQLFNLYYSAVWKKRKEQKKREKEEVGTENADEDDFFST